MGARWRAVGTGVVSAIAGACLPLGVAPIAPAAASGITVTAIAPSSGPAAGGTAVTVTGTGFLAGDTVRFVYNDGLGNWIGSACTDPTTVDSTTITCTSPAQPNAGVSSYRIQVAQGLTRQRSATDLFTYTGPVPVVSGVSPGSGSAVGGTVVVVSGSGFRAG
ncbi:MAG: IPT/TIG domain-containing protein, partial [Actinomycetales bacterium]|nr:IPT/TIG domain-containing protein [Actinomycetales bacterium]